MEPNLTSVASATSAKPSGWAPNALRSPRKILKPARSLPAIGSVDGEMIALRNGLLKPDARRRNLDQMTYTDECGQRTSGIILEVLPAYKNDSLPEVFQRYFVAVMHSVD